MAIPLTRTRPKTLTSADLNRQPTGAGAWRGVAPAQPTGAPIDFGMTTTGLSPVPPANGRVGSSANPSPSTINPQKLTTGLTPVSQPVYDPTAQGRGTFADQNARANAGVYDKGTFGAENAIANKTGIAVDPNVPLAGPISGMSTPTKLASIAPPPAARQQTEAANPTTGAMPTALPGQATPINPGKDMGFSRRGPGVPAGKDAQESTQDKIRSSSQSTQNDLSSNVGGTGLYARKFDNPEQASQYHSYVQRLFDGGDEATA
jgi:hypothetical protein